QPGWKGSPHAVMRYNSGEPRPMRFMDVMPNPTARILRAVCQSSGVTSN
ncbi:MAG: hypothetical protein JWQ72_1304, partial [Polaromonas sp.]|nr:hypothetical protein [Polaromonas sp.]